jgi:divalent metal cation (Fe/Co/Zn/Cd) transporter
MDVSVPKEQLEAIRETIRVNAEGAIEAHDLRVRQAGSMTFVDFHLVVAGVMPVNQAHEICDRIESSIKGVIERVAITIHVEPEEKAKHSGIFVL